MKRLIFLMLAFVVGVSVASAQSNQELLEAYRNGTLSQSQIENLKKENESQNKNVRRTRQVNVTATNKSELASACVSDAGMLARGATKFWYNKDSYR